MSGEYFVNREKIENAEVDDSVLTITEKDSARIENPLNQKMLGIFWWMVVFVLSVMAGRVFYLNVVKGEHYRNVSQGNSIRSVSVKAPRGKILDRFGETLVFNVPSIDVVAIPASIPVGEDGESLARKLANILKIDPAEVFNIFSTFDQESLMPVLIKEGVTQDESLIILERGSDLPGIEIEKTAIRKYQDSLIFSHILGYEGKVKKEELEENPDYLLTDYIGKQGIEKSYERYLRGEHGAIRVEVNSLGEIKREVGVIDPRPGSDLILNINADLQKKISDTLVNALEKEEIQTAAAVAINPKDGGILALVSIPSFDNNKFAGGITSVEYQGLIGDPGKPMFNRAISGEYPPGSTIKPLIACAALSEGVVNEKTKIESRGGISVGDYFFGDWKVHGFTDVRQAIAVSSDVYFYSVGGGYGNVRGLGMSKMKEYENTFGLGSETGIDLLGEVSGFIPDEQWKEEVLGEKWYVGNNYHAAIGQGYITATPLQVVNYIAAIANGGTLYKPRIVSQIKKNNGEIVNNPAVVKKSEIIDPEIIKIVREGMRMTVTEGTAQILNDLSVEVAGKTGTAQYGNEDKTHGWFVSFAPFDNPEIALVVLVEGQSENDYNAVPVTKEIYEWYFNESK